jgi:hypothetical protein
MDFVRNIFLLLVYIAAANCLPNLFDDWDDSILNTDNIAFVDQGISDIGLSGPQDSTIWDFSDHGSLSFSNHELGPWPVEPTDEEATSSIFQDVTGDQWGTFIATSDGDTTQWNPEVDGTTELLAIDDICPLGYWNRCCHNGVCFWCKFGFHLGQMVTDKRAAPTPVLRAVCSDEQIWCCYDRPVSLCISIDR